MVILSDEEEDKRPSSPSSPTMLRRSSSSSGDSVADDNGNNGIMHIEREIGPSGIKQEQVRNRFAKKQKKGTIDVWWLFDDGGECHCLLNYTHFKFLQYGNITAHHY